MALNTFTVAERRRLHRRAADFAESAGMSPTMSPRGIELPERLSMSQTNVIEINKLAFSYGDNVVLKDIELAVPRGHVVAILGTSGCGKSTLLRLIGGQLRPDRGEVRVEDRVVHEMDEDALYEMRRMMGMMFQKSGL